MSFTIEGGQVIMVSLGPRALLNLLHPPCGAGSWHWFLVLAKAQTWADDLVSAYLEVSNLCDLQAITWLRLLALLSTGCRTRGAFVMFRTRAAVGIALFTLPSTLSDFTVVCFFIIIITLFKEVADDVWQEHMDICMWYQQLPIHSPQSIGCFN